MILSVLVVLWLALVCIPTRYLVLSGGIVSIGQQDGM